MKMLSDRNPEWFFLKPIFARYNLKLHDKPYESLMSQLVKKWLKSQGITTQTRHGNGIDVVDFEFVRQGCIIGLELKGHSTAGHRLTKIIDQLKRYERYVDFLVVIVHSSMLRYQIEKILSVVPKKIRQRILVFRLHDLDTIFWELDKKIEELGEKRSR
jgi:hypothetical protein